MDQIDKVTLRIEERKDKMAQTPTETPDMTYLMLGAVARMVLQVGGSALATRGIVVDAGTTEVVAGSVATLGGFAWSLWQKSKIAKTVKPT